MDKKRVLLVSDYTQLNTGYANYGREVVTRLNSTNKYIFAELACACNGVESSIFQVPWKVYPNNPESGNEEERNIFEQHPINSFGFWKFEKTCLDFKPDVVMTYRDHHMDSFICQSPFRRIFSHIWMPPIDSAPLDRIWIEDYKTADSLLFYTQWGLDLVKNEGLAENIRGIAPPAADDIYQQVTNRGILRDKMSLPKDALIIGMVARNQVRKLFPELMGAFAKFIKVAPREVARRSFLYIHTSYPDVGWNIPELILRNGIQNKVLMTYTCRACNQSYPAFYSDALTTCRGCGNVSAFLPGTNEGISRTTLQKIYSILDCYVQYANCEGFGMPIVEAAACGIPCMAVDHSAMSDVIRKVDGFPIKVKNQTTDLSSHTLRASPDNDDLVQNLINLLSKPYSIRAIIGEKTRQAYLKNFNYNNSAKVWENEIDRMPKSNWNIPRAQIPHHDFPAKLSNYEFVNYCIEKVGGKKELLGTVFQERLLDGLNYGMTPSVGGTFRKLEHKDVYNQFLSLAQRFNYWENTRCESFT